MQNVKSSNCFCVGGCTKLAISPTALKSLAEEEELATLMNLSEPIFRNNLTLNINVNNTLQFYTIQGFKHVLLMQLFSTGLAYGPTCVGPSNVFNNIAVINIMMYGCQYRGIIQSTSLYVTPRSTRMSLA